MKYPDKVKEFSLEAALNLIGRINYTEVEDESIELARFLLKENISAKEIEKRKEELKERLFKFSPVLAKISLDMALANKGIEEIKQTYLISFISIDNNLPI